MSDCEIVNKKKTKKKFRFDSNSISIFRSAHVYKECINVKALKIIIPGTIDDPSYDECDDDPSIHLFIHSYSDDK